MSDIHENAKADWLKLVKRHRKRQHGLPALSMLNTNAGNVEHNVQMFNMMNTPTGDFTVDAVNGNVSSEGMAESLDTFMNHTTTLHYEDLYVTEIPVYDPTKNYFTLRSYPDYDDDYDTVNLTIDWDYTIDNSSIIEFLQELSSVITAFDPNLDPTQILPQDVGDALQDWIETNIAELVDTYQEELQAEFKDNAIEDARENYEYIKPTYEPDYDDRFDMSTRTLL